MATARHRREAGVLVLVASTSADLFRHGVGAGMQVASSRTAPVCAAVATRLVASLAHPAVSAIAVSARPSNFIPRSRGSYV
jgi:hypothetical protein